MNWAHRMNWLLRTGVVLALLALCSCAPQKPTVTPHSVVVTGVGFAGVKLRSDLSAYNPRRFKVTVQAVSGRIVLNDSVPLGTATATTQVVLPARGWQRFFVDLELPWLNLPAAVALAQFQREVPYTFEGNATVGGKIRITVPIRTQGTVPAQELLRAGAGLSELEPLWKTEDSWAVFSQPPTAASELLKPAAPR